MTAITPAFIYDFGALTPSEQALKREEIVRQDEAEKAIILSSHNALTQASLLHRLISKIVSLREPTDCISLWNYQKRATTLLGRIGFIRCLFPNIHFNHPRLYREVVIGKTNLEGFIFPLLITAQIIEQTIALRILIEGDFVGEMLLDRVYSKPDCQEFKPERLFDGVSASSSLLRFKITCSLPHEGKPIAKLMSQIVKEIFFREKEERVEILTGMWESDVFFADRYKLICQDDFTLLARRYHQAIIAKLPYAEGPGPDNMIFYKNVKEKVEEPVLYGSGPLLNPYFYRSLITP